jgi:hypothetical protein
MACLSVSVDTVLFAAGGVKLAEPQFGFTALPHNGRLSVRAVATRDRGDQCQSASKEGPDVVELSGAIIFG